MTKQNHAAKLRDTRRSQIKRAAGAAIKAARLTLDITQMQLAFRMSTAEHPVAPSQISGWETGRITPSDESVFRAERALGVKFDLTRAPKTNEALK